MSSFSNALRHQGGTNHPSPRHHNPNPGLAWRGDPRGGGECEPTLHSPRSSGPRPPGLGLAPHSSHAATRCLGPQHVTFGPAASHSAPVMTEGRPGRTRVALQPHAPGHNARSRGQPHGTGTATAGRVWAGALQSPPPLQSQG